MRFQPSRAARAEAGRWSLAFAQANRGAAGEHIARSSGASLEFQDRRAYQPGDDLRRLDWRALARTDQLLVKLHRAEVAPRLDLACDLSRSMGTEPEKAALAVDLLAVVGDAARAAGFEVRLLGLGERTQRLEPALLERGLEFDSRVPLGASVHELLPLLRPGALRLIVSDFLAPHDARELVRPLATGAGALALVQVLGPRDVQPGAGEALRLVDAESGASLDLLVDAQALGRYLERLVRLTGELETECRRAGARFARLVAGPPVGELCRQALLPAGILAPARG